MSTAEIAAGQQQRLAALAEAGAQLRDAGDLSELLDRALAAMMRLTGAERGCLYLQNEPGDDLQCAAAHHFEPEAPAPDLVHRALSSGDPILEGSAMCVAMRAGGRSIGAAYVDSKPAAAAFTTDELALLAAFAGHAAAAIDAARLREAVQAANEAKSEFISLMTHELRIPLTSIRGYTDLLLKEMAGPLNDSQRQFLSTVRRNLDRMSVLIRDLSDMNRIESGRMHFECVPFALHGLLRTAAGDMQEAFTQRAQTISFSFPDQQTMVRADRSRVAHIVANLLSNAHNYTPEGGQIELRVHSAGGMAQVTVADKGIGIPEADLQQLFTPFFRGEAAAVREQSGWGLGLALARLLVEAQGGEIRCTSRAGEGSTFTFSLPLARPEEDSH